MRLFTNMHRSMKPGGLFIFELQVWSWCLSFLIFFVNLHSSFFFFLTALVFVREEKGHTSGKFAAYSFVLNQSQGFLFFSFSLRLSSFDFLQFTCGPVWISAAQRAPGCPCPSANALLLALTLLPHLPCAHRLRPARAYLLEPFLCACWGMCLFRAMASTIKGPVRRGAFSNRAGRCLCYYLFR